MATIEQCKAALHEQWKTREDLIAFTRGMGLTYITNAGPTVDDFIRANIDRLIDNVHSEGKLDQLGLKLGIPSEAEARRINTVWTNRRSWIAIIVSAAALLLSVIALTRSDTPNEKGDAEASPTQGQP